MPFRLVKWKAGTLTLLYSISTEAGVKLLGKDSALNKPFGQWNDAQQINDLASAPTMGESTFSETHLRRAIFSVLAIWEFGACTKRNLITFGTIIVFPILLLGPKSLVGSIPTFRYLPG